MVLFPFVVSLSLSSSSQNSNTNQSLEARRWNLISTRPICCSGTLPLPVLPRSASAMRWRSLMVKSQSFAHKSASSLFDLTFRLSLIAVQPDICFPIILEVRIAPQRCPKTVRSTTDKTYTAPPPFTSDRKLLRFRIFYLASCWQFGGPRDRRGQGSNLSTNDRIVHIDLVLITQPILFFFPVPLLFLLLRQGGILSLFLFSSPLFPFFLFTVQAGVQGDLSI